MARAIICCITESTHIRFSSSTYFPQEQNLYFSKISSSTAQYCWHCSVRAGTFNIFRVSWHRASKSTSSTSAPQCSLQNSTFMLYFSFQHSCFIIQQFNMDTRIKNQTPSSQPQPNNSKAMAQKQIQNLTNMTVYNLTKKRQLYNELADEYTAKTKMAQKNQLKYFIPYSYKPILYFSAVSIYYLLKKRMSGAVLLIHITVLLTINQYDLNKHLKNYNPSKWEQYEEANRNYEKSLQLGNFSLWTYMKSVMESDIYPTDLEEVIKMRPQ